MNIDGSYGGYSTHLATCVNVEFVDDSNNNTASTEVTCKEVFDENQSPLQTELGKIRHLLKFFRCAFFKGTPRITLIINEVIWATILFIRELYYFQSHCSLTCVVQKSAVRFIWD